jgi:type II secretory pathway component PulF
MSNKNQLQYILKNLQTLLNVGTPLDISLQIIENKLRGTGAGKNSEKKVRSKNKNQKFIDKIINIRSGLAAGVAFGDTLEKNFGNTIPQSLKLFIKIGESSGNLNRMISKGLETQERLQKIRSSLISALSYPLFIFTMAFLMIIAMLVFIVPKITPMFRDMKVELPIYTKILIFISGFVSKYFFVMVILIGVAAGVIVFSFKKSAKFQEFVDALIFKTPLINNFFINYNLSTIAICLSQYLKSGYSIHDSLKAISNSIRSERYKKACSEISEKLKKGQDLSEAMHEFGDVMPNWSDSVGFAVNSGSLPEQFQQFYIESSNSIDQFGTSLKRWSEPVLMLGIGAIVAVFAVSIISPIYGLVQHIGV